MYALTAEKYAAMLKSYLSQPVPTQTKIIDDTGCGRPMVKRAMTLGWPELHLPPLSEASAVLTDPEEVKKQIALEMAHQEQVTIIKEATAEIINTPPASNKKVKHDKEAVVKSAITVAMKSAKAVEKLADHFHEMIENGLVELPAAIRPEHIFMLAKASDTATAALHKALSTEKMIADKPEIQAGAHITNLLIGATAEELRHVALTGQLPPRLLGIEDQVPQPIDIEEVKPTPVTTTDEKGSDA